jgi:hypothetical protein
MQTVTYLALLGALWKLVDAVKNVTASNFRALLTQVLAAIVGIGAAFLMSAADIAKTWDVGAGQSLNDMDGASLVILGLIWGLGTGAIVDFKKAFDHSDTAKQPSLHIASNKNPDPLGGGQG